MSVAISLPPELEHSVRERAAPCCPICCVSLLGSQIIGFTRWRQLPAKTQFPPAPKAMSLR